MPSLQNESFLNQHAYACSALSEAHFLIGQREEALSPIGEAVDIYRNLAESNASTFNGDFAWCLRCLSDRLSDLNHREEALPPIQEAVSIYRKLEE